jgi:hypothetical protein
MAEAVERVAKLSPEERADLLVEYFDWPADRRAEVVERERAKDRQRVVDTEARVARLRAELAKAEAWLEKKR